MDIIRCSPESQKLALIQLVVKSIKVIVSNSQNLLLFTILQIEFDFDAKCDFLIKRAFCL